MKKIFTTLVFLFIAAAIGFAVPSNNTAKNDVKKYWKKRYRDEKVLSVRTVKRATRKKVRKKGRLILEYGVPMKVQAMQKGRKKEFNITAYYNCAVNGTACKFTGIGVGSSKTFKPKGIKAPSKREVNKIIIKGVPQQFSWCSSKMPNIQAPAKIKKVIHQRKPSYDVVDDKDVYKYTVDLIIDDANRNTWKRRCLDVFIEKDGSKWKAKSMFFNTCGRGYYDNTKLLKKGITQKCSDAPMKAKKGAIDKLKNKLPW